MADEERAPLVWGLPSLIDSAMHIHLICHQKLLLGLQLQQLALHWFETMLRLRGREQSCRASAL